MTADRLITALVILGAAPTVALCAVIVGAFTAAMLGLL